MARKNFLSFILNEEITVGGKPLGGDDKEDPAVDYTKDDADPAAKPEDPATTADTPPADDTGTEDDAPDYTNDAPEPAADTGDETPPADDAGTTPPATDTADTETPPTVDGETPDPGTEDDAPDYTADAPEPDAGDTETPPATDDTGNADAAPDYTADSPDGGDTGDAGDGGGAAGGDGASDDGSGEGGDDDENPDYTGDSPEDAADDGSGEDVGDGTAQASPLDDEINQMQSDVFANLSANQISIKVKELKTQYVTLFSDIDGVLERLSQITRKEENITTLQFLNKKFLELKDMVKDALVYAFDDKSYVQNQVTLQELMAIYINLVQIIEELSKGQDKK